MRPVCCSLYLLAITALSSAFAPTFVGIQPRTHPAFRTTKIGSTRCLAMRENKPDYKYIEGSNIVYRKELGKPEAIIRSLDNESSGSLSRVALRKIVSPFGYLYRVLFRAATCFMATFITAVILHPPLNKALTSLVTQGINGFFTQSDVKSKVYTFQKTMGDSSPSMSLAKQTGSDFIGIFFQFVEGLLTPPQRQSKGKQDLKSSGDQ